MNEAAVDDASAEAWHDYRAGARPNRTVLQLVWPRPERPAIVARLRREIPQYQLRHRALPGITGLAQVNLEYDASLEDVRPKVQHDLEYIRCASAWEDARIMAMTIPVILFRRGAR